MRSVSAYRTRIVVSCQSSKSASASGGCIMCRASCLLAALTDCGARQSLEVRGAVRRLADYKSEGSAMSKKIGARNLLLAACVSAFVAAALLAGAGAGATQRTKPAVVNPKTAAVREATAEVLKETSELRKLPVLRQVRSGAQSREEIEQMLGRNLSESVTPAEMRASEMTLKKLGMVPADFQLRPFLIKLLTEQAGGYYDPKTQEFYLADWIDLAGQRP